MKKETELNFGLFAYRDVFIHVDYVVSCFFLFFVFCFFFFHPLVESFQYFYRFRKETDILFFQAKEISLFVLQNCET